MGNPWLDHVKKVWARVKGKMSYRQCLVEAKKSYSKKGTTTKKKGKGRKKKAE